MKLTPVIELAIGKTHPGVEQADYLQAAAAVQAGLRRLPGFRSRQLLAGEGSLWVDLVHWDSLEEALQAAEQFQELPGAQPMLKMLDPDTLHMYHLELVYEDTAPCSITGSPFAAAGSITAAAGTREAQ